MPGRGRRRSAGDFHAALTLVTARPSKHRSVAAALGMVALAVVACTAGSQPNGTATPTGRPVPLVAPPSGATIAPPTATSPVPSGRPAESSAASSATPGSASARPEPSHALTSDLVAEVLTYPDVWAGIRPWPSVAVYADGRVIGPAGLRWLTSDGVAAVRAAFARTGLFTSSRVIPPRPVPSESPNYGHGYATTTMTASVDGGLASVQATNDLPSAEGQRFLDAAERLSHPEAWLAVGAWVPGWRGPHPYVPDRWLLEVAFDSSPGAPASASPDIASIDWPFGSPERFGAPDPNPPGEGVVARCGVVSDEDVQRLLASLRGKGVDAPAPAYFLSLDLGWAAGSGRVGLGLEPALPDDGTTCAGRTATR